jgi:NodT family efflux transporter outer membrane factor (OMF) lipoprotein
MKEGPVATVRGLFVFALSVSTGLSACAVGPNYIAPQPPQARSFLNAPAAAERVAERPAPDLKAWWAGFGDPELASLVARALDQNLDLAQAEARLLQARAQARSAGAALLPSGQTTSQAEYQRQSLDSPDGRIDSSFPGYSRNQQLYDLGGSATWEVDVFGGLRRSAQAARAQYQASAATRAGVRLAVAAETADAYVQVRALQSRLAVTEGEAAAQAKLAKLVRLQFERGVASRLQRNQADGARAGADATIPALKSALEAEMLALEVMVGAQPGSLHAELAAPAAIPAPPAIDTAGGPASLLRRRPDIIAAERKLAAADARIGAAISDYYPKVTLSGVLGYEASDTAQLVSAAAFQPQGVVGVRWRLFDFGRVDSEVAAARGARAEALAAYRQSVLKATADVETSLSALVRSEEQARVLGAGEGSLSRARDAAQAAYVSGHVSLIDVLDADDRLLSLRDQRIQAQEAATRAAISAFEALGGGWDG